MKAWILTHFEPYEDRDVHGVFLSKEKGEAFIAKWVRFCERLAKRLPDLPDDIEDPAWDDIQAKREKIMAGLKWPGKLIISEGSLKSAYQWLALVETEILD